MASYSTCCPFRSHPDPLALCLQIYTFGCNDEGALGRDTSADGSETTPGLVELEEKVVQVSAGDSHTAALTEDGRVFVWGSFRVRWFLRRWKVCWQSLFL